MRSANALTLTLLAAFSLSASELPRPAAPLTIKALDGKVLSLDQLRGKVVLVMFLSTDCGHCKKAMQLLNPIYRKWKDRGLEILGLAINPSAAHDLEDFAAEFDVQFPLARSTRGECTRFAEVSVLARFYVPYMFFVDRGGVIRAEHPGEDREFYQEQETNIPNLLDSLLKEQAKVSDVSR